MTERHYPDKLEIVPLTKPPHATVRVPGSKSITNRALVLGALSEPNKGVQLSNIAQGEDTELMVKALGDLGFSLNADWSSKSVTIQRHGSQRYPIPNDEADMFLGNSGTCIRFLTALVGTGHGRYRLDGVLRMRERPIADLLEGLCQLGIDARSERGDGYPPIIVGPSESVFSESSQGADSVQAYLRGNVSSQYLSALLMIAPLSRKPILVNVEGFLVSQPYVAMTVRLMSEFGIQVESDGFSRFAVPMHPWYQGGCYVIEPDASAASYFFAAAAIGGGSATIEDLGSGSLQGDIRFLYVLCEMGCRIDLLKRKSSVVAGTLRGLEANMNAISDCVPTLAAVACFAEGPTTIHNVAHIRHKESDRIAALATELRKVGAEVEEFPDGLRITPRPLHGAEIETYNDHRIAMSMALIGLKVPGIVIKNPGCVAKTYPGFWDDLEKLRN
jgi:3-phosphoshikimate 1-carboxyvinyltransferase